MNIKRKKLVPFIKDTPIFRLEKEYKKDIVWVKNYIFNASLKYIKEVNSNFDIFCYFKDVKTDIFYLVDAGVVSNYGWDIGGIYSGSWTFTLSSKKYNFITYILNKELK